MAKSQLEIKKIGFLYQLQEETSGHPRSPRGEKDVDMLRFLALYRFHSKGFSGVALVNELPSLVGPGVPGKE